MSLTSLARNLNQLVCCTTHSMRNLQFSKLKPALTLCQQVRWKADDRRALVASMPIKDMGTQGEKGADIDFISRR